MKDLDENDSFWSLDNMLPPSALQKKTVIGGGDVKAVEIELPAKTESKYPPITKSAGERINYAEWLKKRDEYKKSEAVASKKVLKRYEHKNPLIRTVTVTSDASTRELSERFLKNGRALFEKEAEFKGNVSYGSVYPQYATMTAEQLMCYIGFRTELRNGRYPNVDRAYIYLYLYELINLTELITPTECADSIARLICGYPECDEKLFADMCNWLADVCLINELDLPDCIYGDVHPRILKLARMKEIFIKQVKEGEQSNVYRLMLSTGRYDYRTSKFYAEYKEYYDKYIDDAVCYALSEIQKTDHRFRYSESVCTIVRESFFGAYRTSGAKRSISAELVCITHSDEEKRIVSELIRYAENCLRGMLSIKQRLTVSYINLEKKAFIKKYLAENVRGLPSVKHTEIKRETEREIPEYEKLYEPKREEMSLEGAERIEALSWGVTEKLVTAFDEAPEIPETEVAGAIEEAEDLLKSEISAPDVQDGNGVIITALGYLFARDNEGFKSYALSVGTLPDALADRINEYLLDEIGDVGVENDGDGYRIAEWYTEDIEKLLTEYRENN